MSQIESEKSRLIRDLRSGGEELVQVLRNTPGSVFDEVRSPEGWLGRDFIAHMAATDLMVSPRLIQQAQKILDPSVPDLQKISGFPHEWNARETAARRALPLAAVIDELEENRQRLLRRIEEAHEDVFELWLPGSRDTAAGIIRMLSGQHLRQHAKQALGEPLPGGSA